MNEQAFSGYVDRVDQDIISGWAANTVLADQPVNLSIYINGARVAMVRCDGLRADAIAAGFAGARKFVFELKPFLKPGRNHVEVGFEQINLLVPNGSHQIDQSGSADIGDFWSNRYSQKNELMTRWWHSEYIVRRINKRVCGESLPRTSSGLHQLALQRFSGQAPFARGVSIGCGMAGKERAVLKCGLVDHFTLFELSSVGIERGRQLAQEEGLADRMEFRMEDGLTGETGEELYDLVYWNNALHHMFDVKAALEWSRRVLKVGGVLLMDDFVGPTQMQWSDRLLQINQDMRKLIPQKYMRDPANPARLLSNVVSRPDPQAFKMIDPSECADSARILPELLRIFPDAWVQKTGGGIYHLGLNDILHNIIVAEDFQLLEQLLELDDQCIEIGETHYAVAIAVK